MYFEKYNVLQFMPPCLGPAMAAKSDSIGDVL